MLLYFLMASLIKLFRQNVAAGQNVAAVVSFWLLHLVSTALQGKKRKDAICIVIADDTCEEPKVRMKKFIGRA